MSPTFDDIKKILDDSIAAWKLRTGRDPRLTVHSSKFSWETKDDLLAAEAFGHRLVQPELVGKAGGGATANLVIALKDPSGVDFWGQMPAGGPFLPDDKIGKIAEWIEAGAPDKPLQWRPTGAPVASSRTDDIWFLNPKVGWAVNSNGHVLKTTDGGDTWSRQLASPAYLRCVAFANEDVGWVGSLSPAQRLYKTVNGGLNWNLVDGLPANPGAICGISVVNENVVYGSGTNFPQRPCGMIKTLDGGRNWTSIDMQAHATLLVDCLFLDENRGWVVGGKSEMANPSRNDVKPVVLWTEDGGQSWTDQAEDIADLELAEWGWKIQFINEQIGFVSLEQLTKGAILRTDNAGKDWVRFPVNDPQGNANLEGVGFIDELHGWVGGWGDEQFEGGFSSETADGGKTWADANHIGRFINRFRFFGNPVTVGYASGDTIYKLSSAPVEEKDLTPTRLIAQPRAAAEDSTVSLDVRIPYGAKSMRIDFWDRFGAHLRTMEESDPASGPKSAAWNIRDAQGDLIQNGPIIYRVTIDGEAESGTIWGDLRN